MFCLAAGDRWTRPSDSMRFSARRSRGFTRPYGEWGRPEPLPAPRSPRTVRRARARRDVERPSVSTGAMHVQPAARPGQVISRPFASRGGCRRPTAGTIGSFASIASRKLPALNGPTPPVGAPRPLREDDERQAVADERASTSEDAAAIRTPAIHQQVPRPPQVPAQERERPERLLRDDPQLPRQRTRRSPGCRRCSGGSTRKCRCAPGSRRSRPRTSTLTPVVARISHDQARAQPCAK